MDLALTINAWIDEEVMFAQQLGARHIFATADPLWAAAPGWDAQSLARLANRVEKAGLVLAGLHASPPVTEPLAWTEQLLRDAGRAKIELLSLSGALLPAPRSTQKSFIESWLPLADTAAQGGVRLAIPAARLPKARLGVRTQPSSASFVTLFENLPSAAGLDASPAILQEEFKLPAGENQLALDKVFLVSFERERPSDPRARTVLDDLLPISWRLRQAGYHGLIRLGLPAHWKGDTRGAHHARAFATGYLRGVLQAFQSASR